jgi:CRISPR-associated endonuclease/helicase Cas3
MFAHSPRDARGGYHPAEEHLTSVAGMAAQTLGAWPPFAQIAHTAGLTHDLGKCSTDWQTYLQRSSTGGASKGGSVEHVPTSLTAIDLLCPSGDPILRTMINTAVAGHHGHLGRTLAGGSLRRAEEAVAWFRDRLTFGPLEAAEMWATTLTGTTVTKRSIFDIGKDDLGTLRRTVTEEIASRIVHSALIDADWTDTGAWFANRQPRLTESRALGDLADRFQANKGTHTARTRWQELQTEVFDQAIAAANGKPGFYLLDAPTGIGKTRSALGFAFQQAVTGQGARRLVFALPFIALTSQVADETRRLIFGDIDLSPLDVLEHHGLYESTDRRYRYATTNWDATVIVTTTVQLLQSLHSARLGSVRKLHRLAGAVIVLDEWQTIPLGLLVATLQTLTVLVEQFGVTVVLSSATPRHLDRPEMLLPPKTSVLPTSVATDAAVHAARRVRWDVRQKSSTVTDLAEEVAQSSATQRCVVVNTRAAAQDITQAITSKTQIPVVHLSTSMTPTHREATLAQVIGAVRDHQPIVVVATQVIEAGVDVSFPAVWRQQAPLESLIQMAGRCNRRGELGDGGGVVVVFALDGTRAPSEDYRQRTAITADLISQPGTTPMDPAVIARYETRCQSIVAEEWKRSKGDGLSIREQRLSPSGDRYPIIEAKYQMIDDSADQIIVLQSPDAPMVQTLLNEHAAATTRNDHTGTRELRRKLARHAVAIPKPVLKDHPAIETDGLQTWNGPYDQTYGVDVRAVQ